MITHTCNPITEEGEAKGCRVQNQSSATEQDPVTNEHMHENNEISK
jgi:hypothetical protein